MTLPVGQKGLGSKLHSYFISPKPNHFSVIWVENKSILVLLVFLTQLKYKWMGDVNLVWIKYHMKLICVNLGKWFMHITYHRKLQPASHWWSTLWSIMIWWDTAYLVRNTSTQCRCVCDRRHMRHIRTLSHWGMMEVYFIMHLSPNWFRQINTPTNVFFRCMWYHREKSQWNLKRNRIIFIRENQNFKLISQIRFSITKHIVFLFYINVAITYPIAAIV